MKLTLKKRMIYTFTLAFSILIIIIGSLLMQYNTKNYQKQSYDYCNKIVESSILSIDNYFTQLKDISKIIATDNDINDAALYREKNINANYAIELYNQRNVGNKIKQIDVLSSITNALIIGSKGEYLYYYGKSPVRGYNFNKQKWYTKATKGQNHVAFTNFHSTDYLLNSDKKNTVSILTPIYNSNQYFFNTSAYLMCDFNLDPILSDSDESSDIKTAIFEGDSPVYFPQENILSSSQKEQLEQALLEKKSNFILDKDSTDPVSYLLVNRKSAVSGWTILGVMSLKNTDDLKTTNTTFFVILLAISCSLVLLLSTVISRSLLIPMNQLLNKFNQIAKGGNIVEFKITNSVEVNQIAVTTQNMLNRIDKLTSDLVLKEKKLANEQLKVLQHQINPHFLNNMLQSIKALAICGDTASISKIATLLGKILSYSVYNPFDKVQLKSELTYIENYIALQNVRFQNKITYSIDCPQNLQDFTVPKLIIQPLIENSIEHGFSGQKGGHLNISVTAEENELYIAVANSGTVIEPEMLEHLNKLLQQKDVYQESSSIGLLNVNKRLKSCYGSKASLRIFSREGMNTSVVMIIPINKGDSNDANRNDC